MNLDLEALCIFMRYVLSSKSRWWTFGRVQSGPPHGVAFRRRESGFVR